MLRASRESPCGASPRYRSCCWRCRAKDPRAARLAVRARSEGLGAADVDRAFTEERSIVITWLNRGTLHLVRSEDYPLLQSLTTPSLLTGNSRRLRQEGVSEAAAERALKTVEKSLAEEGPLSGPVLRERLADADVRTGGQAFIHLMFLAALRGLVVRGPMHGKQHAYALVEDWLGPQRTPAREVALAELARRYLVGHGPADERDLARWAGLPLRDARAGLTAIAGELVQRPDDLVDLAGRERATELPPPRLLGAFEPLLLGWTSREEIVGPHKLLVTNNGIFRPFALVGGRAVSTWGYAGGKVTIKHLGKLTRKAVNALEDEARAVEAFFEVE
ncbi:MAG: winged helix DNA-binding domain-containing protein [Solirubrobacterales bacterium]